MRALIDAKGEQFAYVRGNTLYTLDDEPSGTLQTDYIVDLEGNRVWRVYGDGVYKLDSMEQIGYLSAETPDWID